jgi:hypothetical protein
VRRWLSPGAGRSGGAPADFNWILMNSRLGADNRHLGRVGEQLEVLTRTESSNCRAGKEILNGGGSAAF